MIWFVYFFFPPTQFERLFFDVTSWRTSQVQSGWHGLVQELRMTGGLLPPNSRLPGLPIQDSWYFLGLEGLFFGENICLNGWFSTQKDRVGESIQRLWNLLVSYKPVIQKHWNTSHIFLHIAWLENWNDFLDHQFIQRFLGFTSYLHMLRCYWMNYVGLCRDIRYIIYCSATRVLYERQQHHTIFWYAHAFHSFFSKPLSHKNKATFCKSCNRALCVFFGKAWHLHRHFWQNLLVSLGCFFASYFVRCLNIV